MKIAIVGAGGVGGYFGARLAAARADVHFLARGAHLEAMRTRGLRIESPKGDLHLPHVQATDDPRAIGPCDIVLFTVKLYDVESAIASLPPLLGPDTVVIPFQNGVESVALLSRALGPSHTAGGTTYITAVISEPGVIKHTVMDSLIFGEVDGRSSSRLEQFLEACAPANFHAKLSPDINVEIWTKFVRLSVFSGMTAVTRSSIGPIVRDPDLFAMLKDALVEARNVAVAKGITVSQTVADVDDAYRRMSPDAKSSMLHDLERGRRLELPWLSGAVVRLGIEVGVPTPIHKFIATVLKPYVNGEVVALRQ
ncbi:MAG TPA: 2-dehydropantoate 2-reductase [Vicinamibacterales bacterium]|nr:2-dehydropantoate 2-reductase [Vicinamibacterales bacterium]